MSQPFLLYVQEKLDDTDTLDGRPVAAAYAVLDSVGALADVQGYLKA